MVAKTKKNAKRVSSLYAREKKSFALMEHATSLMNSNPNGEIANLVRIKNGDVVLTK